MGTRHLVPGLERKDLMEELRIVSLALDAALDAIIVHRTDGTLVRFNEAAAIQAGLSTEEFAQLPPWGWTTYAAFDQALDAAIAGAHRYGDRLGVVYIDLDDFKEVNDTLGHDTGDQVLVTLAERLKDCVRPDDTVARLGGDEFVIILRRMSPDEDPAAVGSRLARVVGEPMNTLGHEVTTNASVGVAIFDPETDDARSLVVKADLAMYAAKQATGETPLPYSADMAPRGPGSEIS